MIRERERETEREKKDCLYDRLHYVYGYGTAYSSMVLTSHLHS